MKSPTLEVGCTEDVFQIQSPICALTFQVVIKVKMNMTQPLKSANYYPQE